VASGDELFHDSLIRRQIYLQMFSDGLSADIVKLLDATEADVHAVLIRRLSLLEAQGFDTGPATTARLKVLEQSIKALRDPAIQESADLWTEQLQRVAKSEASFINDAFNSAHDVTVDLALPTATALAALVSKTPFMGKLMKDWAKKLAKDDLDRIMAQIRIGLAAGDTPEQIARRVMGQAKLDGADGVVEITRNNARAITRTAVNSIANESRKQTFINNADVFEEEVYVATLDSHTTPICRSLDGNRYPVGEGPYPPQHWGCRSVRVALIGSKLIGKRPAVGDTTKSVDADVSYGEFLARQSAAFQDEVLGPTRGRLFRQGGLTLDRFVNQQGKYYTIDQLETLEPSAFKRAGL
jgi:SPP1 gp7 family putative phage head morphogenesis protein